MQPGFRAGRSCGYYETCAVNRVAKTGANRRGRRNPQGSRRRRPGLPAVPSRPLRARPPLRLLEAIEYSLMAGGKRLRPALVLETARACGASAEQTRSALAAAGAIELIHTFSLVHDDLPAMDDDDLRRGRPTNHKVFGEAMAILAGDAMVTMAFEVHRDRRRRRPSRPRWCASSRPPAGPHGMIGGQVLDIDGENATLSLDELRQLHAHEDRRAAHLRLPHRRDRRRRRRDAL